MSKEEHDLYLEFKRKELDDQDVDAQDDSKKDGNSLRYLVCCYIHLSCFGKLDKVRTMVTILGDMVVTYFVSVTIIVVNFLLELKFIQ